MPKDLLVTIDVAGPLPGQLRQGGRPAAVTLDRFVELAQRNATRRDYERVIFVGDGEALEQHGFAFVEAARAGGFDHVRLDTSARRLTEARQVRAVVLAGVDEFSVALHGDSAELHDALTQRTSDFAKTQTCLERLSKHEVRVFVDTIVTTANLEALPQIVELAIAKGAKRIALWTYRPSSHDAENTDDAEDTKLIVGLDALIPALHHAIAQAREADVEVVVRHVPACLLGEHQDALDNTTPDALDGVRPGRPLPSFNCLHEAKCELSEICLGLHHAHVNAHGWELDRLQPVPRARPWRERDRSVEHTTGGVAGPSGHGAWLAILGQYAQRIEGVSLTRTEARYPMHMPDGETRFILVLTARDDDARTFTQSRSFNLAYTDVEGPAQERAIATYIEPVLATIVANDDGSLCLDAKP